MSSEAEQAFLASALDALGVWDLLGELADREARAATFAVFRAHGRELGRSAALGCLLAHPYSSALGFAPGSIALAIPRASVRRGDRLVLLGEPSLEHVLVDSPGVGASMP